MKNSLLFITHDYPLERGDTAFISSEIEYMSHEFDQITVLSLSNESSKQVSVPSNCSVHYLNYSSRIDLVFKVLLSKSFYSSLKVLFEEFKDIADQNKVCFSTIITAIKYYFKSVFICNRIKEIVPSNAFPSIIYSFWSGEELLASTILNYSSKVCARVHGYDLYEERAFANYQPFKKVLDRRIDLLLFISDQGLNYYFDKYKTGSSCEYAVSYLGSHCYNKAPKYIEIFEPFEIISVSSVIPLKRLDMIIDALSHINQNIRVHWTHIGDGQEFENIKTLAEERLSNLKNITYSFLGSMNHENVLLFLKNNNVHAFINTSSTEGLPVSMMEALSYSIPIIGIDVGGVSEIVDSTDGILLPDTACAQDISSAIETLAKLDKKSYSALRKGAYNKWESTFNADTNYRYLAELLKQ